MKLQALEYFIALAESRSINEAARRLYVAQPSLTKALQHLEKELGRTLTKEEEALARKAYKLGRKKAFDIPVKKKKDKKDFSGENN